MAKQPTNKVLTKKHLARLEKERLQERYLMIGTGVVIVLVIAIILYGVLDQAVFKQMRPVARVGTENITVSEFQKQVRFTRYRLIEQLRMYMSDQLYVQFFSSYITQLQTQLASPSTIGQQVLDQLIEQKLVEKEAKQRGITLSSSDLDQNVEEAFGFFENGTPTPTSTATPYVFSTSTLSPTQLALVGPSATPVPTEAATATPTGPTATATTDPNVTATATLAASPTITLTPTITSTPTITPTPTEYTRDLYNKNVEDYVSNVKSINLNKNDLVAYIRTLTLRQKVYDAITADVPDTAEQVWARHILVATEEEAKAVLDRLNKGEKFADLAAELSTDTSNKDKGGDLEWFTRDMMVTEFSDAAFALNVGEISQPVQTTYGYHVIQVLGKEVRPLTADQLSQAKDKAYQDWLEAAKEAENVKTYDNWIDYVPSDPEVPAELQQSVGTGQ